MFASRQVRQVEEKVQQVVQKAQRSAGQHFEVAVKNPLRILRQLGERSQAELRPFLTTHEDTRKQWVRVGAELVRIGEYMIDLATPPAAQPAPEEVASTAFAAAEHKPAEPEPAAQAATELPAVETAAAEETPALAAAEPAPAQDSAKPAPGNERRGSSRRRRRG